MRCGHRGTPEPSCAFYSSGYNGHDSFPHCQELTVNQNNQRKNSCGAQRLSRGKEKASMSEALGPIPSPAHSMCGGVCSPNI